MLQNLRLEILLSMFNENTTRCVCCCLITNRKKSKDRERLLNSYFSKA